MTLESCPVCGDDDLVEFHRRSGVPVLCNALHPSAEAALAAPSGDIVLARCERCDMIWNRAFDPSALAYDGRYENALGFSEAFRAFATELAERLAAPLPHGAVVVELGCGQGEFLELLCRRPDVRGIGIDPAYRGPVTPSPQLRFDVGSAATVPEIRADLVCARHVLEHLDRPAALLDAAGSLLGDGHDGRLYLEVPDADYMLDEVALWDVVYEHPLYFGGPALRHLVESEGFEVGASGSAFGDQYLWVECTRPAQPSGHRPMSLTRTQVHAFDRQASERIERCASTLARAAADGRPTALWGTGSKGATFLNTVPGASGIDVVVDVNPRKHGLHVPGTGHRVSPPAVLRDGEIAQVLVLNPNYRHEVAAAIEQLGVRVAVVAA